VEGAAILLSPHLDDAVISAWSLLTGAGSLQVVNVCTGVPAADVTGHWDRLTGAQDSRVRMRERLAEDAEALRLAGRTPLNLGFLDDQYRAGPLEIDDLREALLAVTGPASAIHAPAALGGHRDHVAVRELALRLGVEWGASVTLYADLPYAVRFGWPAWVTGERERRHLVPDARWERYLEGVSSRPLTPQVHELSDEEAARKLQALETYATQFEALNAGALGRMTNPEVRRWEVRFTVDGLSGAAGAE
jgi:LmbE family N-acetylglucosaminyl deacetylase